MQEVPGRRALLRVRVPGRHGRGRRLERAGPDHSRRIHVYSSEDGVVLAAVLETADTRVADAAAVPRPRPHGVLTLAVSGAVPEQLRAHRLGWDV